MSKFRNVLTNIPHTKVEMSLLSTDQDSTNYRGFLNLGAIILVVSNFRLIIENILKYGVLLRLPSPVEFVTEYRNWPCLTAYFLFIIPALATFYIEKLIRPKFNGLLVLTLHLTINLVVLIAPLWLIWVAKPHFINSVTLLELACVVSMKQISFAHIWSEVHHKQKSEIEEQDTEIKSVVAKYPESIHLSHYLYFLAAPTLCFQFSYPRTESIRRTWLLKRVCEFILSVSLATVMVVQYMFPLVYNTIALIDSPDYTELHLLERHLKLAIPNLFIWLLMFYSFFHCWLNILAELLRFGDRSFYLDWWNARTLGEYWRKWNLPVHFFLTRHVYSPMVNIGSSRMFAMFTVFFISAVAHEYLISGSFTIVSYWAFLSMIGQVPLIVLMDRFKEELGKTQLGNVSFWVMFCIVGQPLCVIIYSYYALSKGITS